MQKTYRRGKTSTAPERNRRAILTRSLAVSCVVGPALLLVNHGPTYLPDTTVECAKAAFTLLMPFLVSFFSGTMARSQVSRELSRNHENLESILKPVSAKVVQIETNALLVNQTAKARFEETSALLDQARGTMHDLLRGRNITEQAMQAIGHVLSQFQLVLEADSEVRAAITENLATAKDVSTSVASTRVRFDEISDLALEIGRIGHQTTLLSLNAAIVAAAAGPEGKPFAVIAQSIRHLARETEALVKTITSTINELQTSASVMADDSEQLSVSMGRLLQCSDKAGEVVLEAKGALLQSSEVSKSSLQLQARQASDIEDIGQGIERVVDHASSAIDGSARNAALAREVSHNLEAISAHA